MSEVGEDKRQTIYYARVLPDGRLGRIGEITYDGEPIQEGMLSYELEYMESDPIIGKVIVRCEDCKYFKYGNGCILQSIDYDWEEQMYADDFCSRGERKDD